MNLLNIFQSVPLWALFGLTLLVGLFVGVLILVCARQGLQLIGFSPGHRVDIESTLISAVAALFALMLAFSAAGIWADTDRARSVVEREASSLETVLALAHGLPQELEETVREGVGRYVNEVVRIDWPAMAQGIDVNDPRYDVIDGILVQLIEQISTSHKEAGANIAADLIIGQIVEARSARLVRISLAGSGVSKAQWVSMLTLAVIVLVVIAICHNDRPRERLLSCLLYVLAASAAFFIILAHDHPFLGSTSVGPASMSHILTSSEAPSGTGP